MWWPCLCLLAVWGAFSENVEFGLEKSVETLEPAENVSLKPEKNSKRNGSSENVELRQRGGTVKPENVGFELGGGPRKKFLLDSGETIVKIEKVCSLINKGELVILACWRLRFKTG